LRFAYGEHPVLADISLELRTGELLGLIGPNGSGKSTLLALLMGLLRPTGGSIEVGSKRVDGLSTPHFSRLGIAKTFQRPRSFATLTVMDNLIVGHRAREHRPVSREWLAELLDRVNLLPYADVKAGQLSVGQQKLLDLCRAVAMKPRILLLDEVTAGVHPSLVPTVLDLVSTCVGPEGAALLVTHELDVARTSCTRLLALHNGEVVAEGAPEHVLRDQRVVEAYLGA
jgi:ABC-type branched-subunit amino acid transport system ATPase component